MPIIPWFRPWKSLKMLTPSERKPQEDCVGIGWKLYLGILRDYICKMGLNLLGFSPNNSHFWFSLKEKLREKRLRIVWDFVRIMAETGLNLLVSLLDDSLSPIHDPHPPERKSCERSCEDCPRICDKMEGNTPNLSNSLPDNSWNMIPLKENCLRNRVEMARKSLSFTWSSSRKLWEICPKYSP